MGGQRSAQRARGSQHLMAARSYAATARATPVYDKMSTTLHPGLTAHLAGARGDALARCLLASGGCTQMAALACMTGQAPHARHNATSHTTEACGGRGCAQAREQGHRVALGIELGLPSAQLGQRRSVGASCTPARISTSQMNERTRCVCGEW
jgi:hypothetical protein